MEFNGVCVFGDGRTIRGDNGCSAGIPTSCLRLYDQSSADRVIDPNCIRMQGHRRYSLRSTKTRTSISSTIDMSSVDDFSLLNDEVSLPFGVASEWCGCT